MDDSFVVLKLVSGETLMGTYIASDSDYIKVEYPVLIKSTYIPETNKEQINATPFCPFTESVSFVLEKEHVVYIKPLGETFIAYYLGFIAEYDMKKSPVSGSDEAFDRSDSEDEQIRMYTEGNKTKH